jgi:hypothetical protein
MKGSINDKGLRLNYYQVVDIIGKYTLTGSHSKGDLNGPFAMDANMTVTKRPGSSEAVRYTFRGNFKNGLPHGNFKVEYPSYGTKVNVNYNNGKLVGSFYAKGLGSDDMPFTTSGTLTSTGKPTGTWTFTGVYGTSKKTFSNGVITQLDAYDSALSAKAKAFAAGSISEEQLLKENILVKRDSISVGDDVSDLILNGGIQFRKLGGYDFSQADYVYYNYLERIVTFSIKGIEELTKAFSTYDSAKSIVNSGYNFYGDTASGVYGEFYGGAVNYDNKLNMYYIILPKDSSLSEYCQGYPRWEGNQSRVYFINGQFETIRKSLHDQRMTRLGQKPFAELNRQKINAQYLQNYCFASPYDNDVVAYFSTSDYDTYYYKREDFEDYFINNGLGQQVLE